MLTFQDEIKTLSQLGLTSCQARAYLVLLHSGKASAKEIAHSSKIAKPDIYRVIESLQEIGLVEKTLGTPAIFSAVPVEQSLDLLFRRKEIQNKTLETNAKQMMLNLRNNHVKEPLKKEEWFTLLPPKMASIEKRRKLISVTQESIDVLSSLRRLKRIAFEYHDDLIGALRKGVRFRIITEKPETLGTLPDQTAEFSKQGPFDKRYTLAAPPISLMIFDKKETLISTSASANLGEAPTLWTNNPPLIAVMKEYFETMWNQATIP
jgi:sugar-specific transcriptional regulator TrmB